MRAGAEGELVAAAVRILRDDPSAGDGCERDNSVAGGVLTRAVPPVPRWATEAAVREARQVLDQETAASE